MVSKIPSIPCSGDADQETQIAGKRKKKRVRITGRRLGESTMGPEAVREKVGGLIVKELDKKRNVHQRIMKGKREVRAGKKESGRHRNLSSLGEGGEALFRKGKSGGTGVRRPGKVLALQAHFR